MPLPIEDYAVIGDTQTAALVGQRRLDRLAVPAPVRLRRDLRRAARHRGARPLADRPGRRRCRATRRRYRGDTLVLETEFDTDDGTVRLIDFMPPRGEAPDVVRIVEGVRGRVPMRMDLRLRFDYGHVVPVGAPGATATWSRSPGRTRSGCAPRCDVHGENLATVRRVQRRRRATTCRSC